MTSSIKLKRTWVKPDKKTNDSESAKIRRLSLKNDSANAYNVNCIDAVRFYVLAGMSVNKWIIVMLHKAHFVIITFWA